MLRYISAVMGGVLAFGEVFGGCAQPTEETDKPEPELARTKAQLQTTKIELEALRTEIAELKWKQANLLITHNSPATQQWGGASRVGGFYMSMITAYEAAQSGKATNIAVVFLPEATDVPGGLDSASLRRDIMGLDDLPAEIDTWGKFVRYLKEEFAVTFYVWDVAIGVHPEFPMPDFVEPITCSKYAELVTNAGRVVDF